MEGIGATTAPGITGAEKTLAKISEYWQNKNGAARPHLGGSMIGDPCERKLWYSFRWVQAPNFSPRIMRLFDRGQKEEQRFIDELKATGATVWECQPDGNQYRYTAVNGHFAGSLDGVAVNLPDDRKSPHLLEFKTHGEKSFKSLAKDGLKKSKPVHYAQMQVYMLMAGLKKGLYLAVNKNNDQLYAERIVLVEAYAEGLIAKAELVINAKEPPQRLHNDASRFECKWCDYRGVCHGVES